MISLCPYQEDVSARSIRCIVFLAWIFFYSATIVSRPKKACPMFTWFRIYIDSEQHRHSSIFSDERLVSVIPRVMVH